MGPFRALNKFKPNRNAWPSRQKWFAFVVVAVLAPLLLLGRSRHTLPSSRDVEYLDLGNARMTIARIPAGNFSMGTDEVIKADDNWRPCSTCPARNDLERPAHQVTITKEFWMGQVPVTQRQWQAVMNNNPSYPSDLNPDAPVNLVSWEDTQKFIAKVNDLQRRWVVRLPTEAEWEYAARAGTKPETYAPLNDIAWYKGNYTGTTHPVGKKLPNAFGLYDMLGNVWQWCNDWFGPYSSLRAVDPTGPSEGDRHPTRGGCFYCDPIHERAARRNRDVPSHTSRSIGFRIVALPRN